MKVARYFVAMMIAVFSLSLVSAQGESLAYGDEVEGEITNQSFEVEYSFEGSAGDVVLLSLVPEDTFDGLSNPTLILLDSEFEVLETVSASFSSANIIYELDADGTYNVIATREDGRSGDSAGPYTLSLDTATLMSMGEPVEVEVSSEGPVIVVAFKPDGEFDLKYNHVDGDFYPEVSLNKIESGLFGDTNLTTLATLYGPEMQRGTVGLVESAEGIYIITIAEAAFDFNFQEVTATVSLEIVSPE